MINIKRKIFPLILVFFFMVPLFGKLINPGFFSMHDDTQPVRIFEMVKVLTLGRFPVRWVPDLGYGFGYPLFNFYAPLPYYIGSVFVLLGVDVLVASKLMIGIGIVLSGLGMFFLGRTISKSTIGALLVSILYTYAPYHASQVYVRGAIGELYGFAFLPMYFMGIALCLNIGKQEKNEKNIRLGIMIGTIGLAGILLSHNIIGFLTLFFSGIFLFVCFIYSVFQAKFSKIIPVLMIFFLGIGISAFFIIPAIGETKYTSVSTLIRGGSDYHLHFLYLDQLWDSPWGFGGSGPGRSDGMSFKLGKIHLLYGLFSILFFIFLVLKKKLPTKQKIFFMGVILIFLISIYCMLASSSWIYEVIPGFAFIQYPWRFLVYALFSLSLLPLIFFYDKDENKKTAISFFFIFIIILVNTKYFNPQQIFPISSSDYTNIRALHTTYSKISDEYMPNEFIRSQKPASDSSLFFGKIQDNFTYEITRDTSFEKIIKVQNKKTEEITAGIAYFPGWKAFINNVSLPLNNVNGKISFTAPPGEYFLKLKFVDTPVERLSNSISIFTVFLLLYVSLLGRNVMVWVQKHL